LLDPPQVGKLQGFPACAVPKVIPWFPDVYFECDLV
jgi:hypothetical protein